MNSVEKKKNEIDNKKKDPSIELLRIIGCFSVIGTHIKWQIKKKKKFINFSIIFNGCLCADGVAIFWYIMGFFFFKKISYKKRLNILFKKICVPVIITSFFYFYFSKFNFNKIEIKSYLLKKTKYDYLNLFYNILIFNESSHLWFCYVYILIVILYPSFEGFNNYFEINKINSYKIFLLFLSIAIENDFFDNKVMGIEHHGFNGVLGAIPFIFCGNELKKNINKFKNKKIFSIFIIFFIGINYLRSKIIFITKRIIFIKWYSSFGIINGFFLFIFAYSLNDILHNKILYFLITKISSFTYYIYLIHPFVIDNVFRKYKLDKKLTKNYHSIKALIFYQTISTILVFINSLFISIFLSFLIKIFCKIINYINKLFFEKEKKD